MIAAARTWRRGRWLARGTVLLAVTAVLAQAAGPAGAAPVAGSASAAGTATAARAASAPADSYTYDADGRLATVTDAAGTVATYHYDAVGNVTSITRTAGPKVPAASRGAVSPGAGGRAAGRARPARPQIAAAGPTSVRAGQRVTITGHGFSPRPALDVVKVGSLLARVVAASPSRLTVAAPPGSGGAVTVHTPGGSATAGLVAIAGGPRPAVQDTAADRVRLRAPAGVTALAGQVDTAAGTPLPGVRVTVSQPRHPAGVSTVTNTAGQFLLSGLTAGHRSLTIDGSQLSGGRDYGIYGEPVELPAGRTTVLPWVSYLSPIDTTHAITIASPTTHEVTLTTPRIPGLEVRIPAGTVIRDHAGHVLRSLSITPLPTDRTPMPWGPGMAPAFFTIQPGDATVTGPGLQVIYPNSTGRPPGEPVAYLTESPDWPGTGWWRYGSGHVSANGKQILPDPGTRYNSTDPGGYSTLGAPGQGPPPGGNCQCGDPVDLATGLFVDQSTDISLPDTEGITFTRTSRQLDDTVRDFGVGGSDSLDLYIVATSSGDYDLILPDGGAVSYAPTTATGVYQAVSTPTDYAGSTLTQSTGDPDGPFTLQLRNGTQLSFGNPAFLTAVTDRYGNTLTINRTEYQDAAQGGGQLQTVTTPDGRWLSFSYGDCVSGTSTECITQITDNAGRTVSYGYNGNGQLTSVTNVNGGVTKYGWASCTTAVTCTELTSITDPLGRVTKIAYSGTTGMVTQQTQPNGGLWKYAYTLSSAGAVTKAVVTDPDGHESATSFAANGYPTSNTTGYGTSVAETSTASYVSGTGLVKSATDPLGRTTSYTYDALGDPLTVTVLSGTSQAATTTYTYEPTYHRLASVTDPLGHKTTFSYNDKAGTETITDPLGHSTLVSYNDHGQVVSTRNPLGGVTYYSYFDGDLVATAEPLGNVSATYYDSVGRPLEVTDPDGNTSSYTYDAAGDKLTSTDPLGYATTFGYDADGELTSVTDANGNKTSYTYDALGDVLTATDPLGKTATWTYDADGNALTATDRDGNVTDYTYDALGRPATAAYGVTSSATYDTVTTSYDQASRPTKIVDSRAGTYSYSYDNLNDVTQYSAPQGSISYTYNNSGQRTGMTVVGQSASSYTYDADGDLTKLTQGSATTGYTYNAGGELTQTTLPNGVVQTSTYDAAADLTGTSAATSGTSIGSVQYSYDADGRILTATGSLATVSLPAAVSSETYNADDELTAINGGTKLTYDSNGSLTSDGTNSYTWNPLNELASVTTPSATSSYAYNPGGQQASATTSGTTTSNLYDGGTLVQQSSGGTPVASYLSTGPGGLVQVQNTAGTTSPLVSPVGSTTALTGSTGKIATTYSYDPAGNASASGTANPNPEQFAASQAGAAGLDLMGARYYDPAIGRFISQDPLGLASGSVNSYEYAGDDPINANDPGGMCGGLCQGLANFGAGLLNGLSFGIFHVPPPFCGPGLGFAYGLGGFAGGIVIGVVLGGVGAALLDGIGAVLEASEAAEAAGDLLAEESDAFTATEASESASVAEGEAAGSIPQPSVGQTLYRVYGGDSEAGGASWTPVDPSSVPNFRDAAGLPSGGASGATNTGQFVIQATLNDPSAVVLQRSAGALDGMKGGLPEYIIPNWMENGAVTIQRVSGVNPEF
jgi:RHS repeat-associated protein